MTTPTSPQQTLTFLLRRFEEAGIKPQKRHGQNFLIDLNLLRLLFDSAQVGPEDVVLEIGGGTGSLTALLAEQAAAVVSVEIDPQLFQLARESLYRFSNVTMLAIDALKNKNHFDPRVLEAVNEKLAEGPNRRFKLVANLPYNIVTPVVANLLRGQPVPQSMTVTIQKEVADRITARPNSKDYGALSVWVQSQCLVNTVRSMPPSAFWPRPKVMSAIVHMTLEAPLRERIADLEFFHAFVRAIFAHRRKFLRSVILAGYKGQLTKDDVDAIMQSLALGADRRAEQLDLQQMLALCEAIRARVVR